MSAQGWVLFQLPGDAAQSERDQATCHALPTVGSRPGWELVGSPRPEVPCEDSPCP